MARVLRAAAVAVFAIALSSGIAGAAQKMGVEVYPGAKQLPSKSAYVKAKARVPDAFCYRTSDGADAVVQFVQRQAGFRALEPYLLRRASVDVVVHPPTTDPKTGVTSPTVFCIMTAKD